VDLHHLLFAGFYRRTKRLNFRTHFPYLRFAGDSRSWLF
jgi:hypothetical protein